jgi:hypothetical protein
LSAGGYTKLNLFEGLSAVLVVDTLVEGPDKRITLYDARVVFHSVELVSRLEASWHS